jgi:hypothetical protein
MEMYTPLPGGQNSRFFLAQIDQTVGAGKTMEIDLYDPGDTGQLSANMRVLTPCASGCAVSVPNPQGAGTWSYNYANFTVSATLATPNGNARCSSNAPSGSVSTLKTSNGGGATGLFNGCWVTIDVPIPTTYTAPSSGWWMVEYDMGGIPSNSAFDVTSWQVNVVGNPVHLVVP